MRQMPPAVVRRPFGPCLETLARNCDDAILIWDTAGLCTLANAGAERLLGRPERELAGLPMREIVPAGDPAKVDACVAATLRDEPLPETERDFLRPGGAPVTMRVRCSTLRDGTGAIVGGVAVLHDLTPRRSAEAARDASDTARHAVFDASLDAIVVVDAADRYVDANPAACSLLGRTREDVLRHHVGDFAAPGWDGLAAYHGAVATGAGGRTHRIARPDGTEREVVFDVRRDFLPGLHLGVFRDVTEERQALRALRASESRFRALFDGIPAPVVVFRAQPDGSLVVVEANRAVMDVVGDRLQPGLPAAEFLAGRTDLVEFLARCARERTLLRTEVDWTSFVDGRPLRFRGFACFVEPDLVVGFGEDVTAQRAAEAERATLLEAEREARAAAEAAEQRHRRLARRVTEILEAERATLARGLHDELGQELTALRIRLESALRPGADARRVIAAAGAHATEILERVRDLSLALRPPMLDDLGLVAAVVWNAKRFASATGVHVDFEQDGADRRFAPGVELAAYRIVQEALTNVARHSGAKVARVRIWVRGCALFAEVEDPGRGFDAEAQPERGRGAGLAGMRERAELVGGTLTVESSPDRGTVITAVLPAARPEGRS